MGVVCTVIGWEKAEEKKLLEKSRLDGRIILRWIFMKLVGVPGLARSG
jgi:hypothetical protein